MMRTTQGYEEEKKRERSEGDARNVNEENLMTKMRM